MLVSGRVVRLPDMNILVLDADKNACDLLVRTLQGFFPEHDWLQAGSYEEGRQLALSAGRLDFVLADLKTNEAGGPSLAHLIEGMFPDVQVYFLGTYSNETTFFRARPGRIFAKPVNVREVVAAIHLAEEHLAQHGASAETKEAADGSLEKINRLIAHEGFSGQLAQFQLHEIVQICCLGQRTGRMSVTKGHESGVFYFHEGRLLHAECGDLQGDAAASRIIGWRSGQFTFTDGILADRETIEASWDFLLLETMQKLDEAAAIAPAARPELEAGRCFGPYQLVRRLTTQEQEHVFEAQAGQAGLLVNLHVLPAALTGSPAAVKHFVAEAAAKSELDSPVFLRSTKAAQTEGVYYHTSEHIEAASLDAHGTDLSLNETQVLEVFRAVSKAMSELQAQHQLHRPLSSRDVLIDARGGVRLANLVSLRPSTRLSVPVQIAELAGALRQAAGSAGIRSASLKRLLKRIERPGSDQITSWAGLRKATEGISLSTLVSPGGFDEHTSFIVNLVPDRPTLGVFKLVASAALAGLLVGALFWVGGQWDRVSAREQAPASGLMAAEISMEASATNSIAAPDTNAPADSPRIYGSINEVLESSATLPFEESGPPQP